MSNEGFPSSNGENFENEPDRSTSQARGNMTLQAAKSQEQKPDLGAAQEAYQKEIFDKMDECRRLAEGILANLRKNNQSNQPEAIRNNANVSPDKARELNKKARSNKGFKKFLIGGALAGVAGAIAFTFASRSKNPQTINQQAAAIETAVESEAIENNDLSPIRIDGIEEWGETSLEHESISERSSYHGMFASEDGSTYNPEKNSDVCFGEALKSGVSESEMKEDLNSRMVQPAQLAAQYVYMSKITTNPNFGVSGVKFDNPNDLIKAMKSDESLHQSIYDYVTNAINDGKIHEETVSGRFNNYYMTSNFETGDSDTSNVEIVGCATNEDGTKVYVLEQEWFDENGERHTDVYLQKEKCGGQDIHQIEFTGSVNQIDESTAHHHSGGGQKKRETETNQSESQSETNQSESQSETTGQSETNQSETTPSITTTTNTPNQTQPKPQPKPQPETQPQTQPETQPETHPAKNTEAEKQNAGEYASPMTADPNQINSEEAHESQEATNRDSVAEQAAEDAKKAEEAQAASEAQSAAEAQAAAEAEKRRQEEAAAEQQRQQEAAAASAAEQQRQQEEAARQEAERQAAARAAEEEAARQAAAAAEQQRQQEEAARQAAAVQAAADANAAAAAETVEPAFDADSASDFAAAAGEMGL